MTVKLYDPLQTLPGIGPAPGGRLEKLGLRRVEDLLYWFPRDYEDPAAPVHGGQRPGGREMLCGGGNH